MGSPCEVLCDTASLKDAQELTHCAARVAWRIEDKLSRYIAGNIIDRINSSDGDAVSVDEETASLIDFSMTLFRLSDGAFDITSGVLRRAWRFDGGDELPTREQVEALLGQVGSEKIDWRAPVMRLVPGMEIDLGGVAKEYAVDRAIVQLRDATSVPSLVNFGGDLAVTGPPATKKAWTVGIEAIDASQTTKVIDLVDGAIATSGDAQRFLFKDGIRYSHVLDPRTGWPIEDAASSITVAADTCTQAGMLATLAMLKGKHAEGFLLQQNERSWIYRQR